MSDYDNTNRGLLSKNNKRETDKHPEYTGSINVEGVEYRLNAWVRERKDGSGKFFSLSVKPKEKLSVQPKEELTSRPLSEELNDEIPF